MIKAGLLTCLLAAVLAQDNRDSQYVLKYEGEDHSHVQRGNAGHAVTGYYSYKDVSGKTYRVHYVADEKGYRVIGSSGLAETKAADNAPVITYDAPMTDAAPTEPVAQMKTPEESAAPAQPANENPGTSATPASPTAPVVQVKVAEEDLPSTAEEAVVEPRAQVSQNGQVTDSKTLGETAVPPIVYYLVTGLPVPHSAADLKSVEDKKTDKFGRNYPMVYYIVPGPSASPPVTPLTTEKRNGQEKNPLVPVPYLRNSPYGYPFALPFGYPMYG